MNKEKLVQMLEHELVQADAATTDEAFDKHIYAIHALTALYTAQDSSTTDKRLQQTSTRSSSSKATMQVTDEEIKQMGGQVSSSRRPQTTPDQRMVTDDEIGNGASIFDF